MIELEEHGSSHHKEGGLNLVPTLESEKFSEVGSSKCYLLIPTQSPTWEFSVFYSFFLI
jgi:hypothetical protein